MIFVGWELDHQRSQSSTANAYLSDILVAHPASLLDVGSALGDVLQGVAGQDKLVLLALGNLDIDALLHCHPAHNLLADEVADLDLEQTSLAILVHVDVDGEMGVDVAHLVLEALGHADDEVVDDGADGAEGGDALAVAMVDLDGDGVLLGLTEDYSQMAEVLDELPCKSLLVRNDKLMQNISSLLSPRARGIWNRGVGSYLGDPRR